MKRFALVTAVMLAICGAFLTPADADDDLELLEERAMQAAVAEIAPSVVRIETFGGLEKVGRLLVGTGPTTGLIVAEDGYILSSAFNFVQKPTTILVTLPNGEKSGAKIVARDHSRMLALLKVKSSGKLPVPQTIRREDLVVGQWAVAVGRTFEGGATNLSVGIISATNRIWGRAVQTDAKISPANYGGPLVDIHGRVIGILVPLSPRVQGEVAGAEWYDSGIGFAVPLAEVLVQIDKMKKGEDLYRGVLGVSLKPGNMFADPAVIAACHPASPAAEAGLKAGDKIIEIDGKKIERQSVLKHELGPKYAGEKVAMVVMRGKDRIEVTVELTDKLVPYEHPFLGILPMRDADDRKGVVVRYVYPGSPAAESGIQTGDRITDFNGKAVPDAGTMQEMVATASREEKVKLTFERSGKTTDLQIALATLPTEIPGKLPAARKAVAADVDERPPVGILEIKVPEEPNKCMAYVPENYDPALAHGLVVWLHPAGGLNRKRLVERWKDVCQTQGLILLAPMAADPKKWQRTEVAFVSKAIDEVMEDYHVDRTRIVAHGYRAGAAVAYLVGFTHRDRIRGVAAVDAALPAGSRPPVNDPIHRLAFYITRAEKSPITPRVDAGIKVLRDMKYPITVEDQGEVAGPLTDEQRAALVRWIDTLDRI
jgi:serine protease Do